MCFGGFFYSSLMNIRKRTLINLLLMAVVLSFFVTPLGHFSKVALMRLFAFTPKVLAEEQRETIKTYDWKLKDASWNFFNFNRSAGKVVLVNFWASWRLPSLPELQSIQKLYDDYGKRVDFYIITDENREPVEIFMEENHFNFPVTYLIIGEPAPVAVNEPPRTYLIDKYGSIVIQQKGIANWNSKEVRQLLDQLLGE